MKTIVHTVVMFVGCSLYVMNSKLVYTLVLGCERYLFAFLEKRKGDPVGKILTGTCRYFSLGCLLPGFCSGIYSILFLEVISNILLFAYL